MCGYSGCAASSSPTIGCSAEMRKNDEKRENWHLCRPYTQKKRVQLLDLAEDGAQTAHLSDATEQLQQLLLRHVVQHV